MRKLVTVKVIHDSELSKLKESLDFEYSNIIRVDTVKDNRFPEGKKNFYLFHTQGEKFLSKIFKNNVFIVLCYIRLSE